MENQGISNQADIPYYKQLKQSLLKRIAAGEFAEDQPIPSEHALCDHYQVSRTTVRQALGELVASGHLFRVRGKGTFVAQNDALRPQARTKLIGFVPNGEIKSDFEGAMFESIAEHAHVRGYNVLVAAAGDDLSKAEAYLGQFVENGVEGIIYTPISSENKSEYLQDNIQVLLQARKSAIPVVLLDKNLEDIELSWVVSDNEAGFHELAEHMIGLGHTTIGVVTNPYSSSTHNRVLGYRRALQEHGIPFQEDLVVQLERTGNIESAMEATDELLRRKVRPTCILATFDLITRGVLIALQDAGISVPDEIAIAGFDNRVWSEHLPVPLTTVAQPTREMGREACRILLDQIEGKTTEVQQIRLPTTLVVRASSGTARAADVADLSEGVGESSPR